MKPDSKSSQLLTLACLALLLHLCPSAASACECVSVRDGPLYPPEALQAYDAVFLGYATNISLLTTEGPVRENEYRYDDRAVVTFRVRRAWKGVMKPSVTVETATQGTACGDLFRVGQYYLVYAHLSAERGALQTDSCTPTKDLSQASHEIVSLGPAVFQAEEKVQQ